MLKVNIGHKVINCSLINYYQLNLKFVKKIIILIPNIL